jgi:hypothetical protein
MITLALCFMMVKAHEWGRFPKCRARLGYHLILGPYLGTPPPWDFTLVHNPLPQSGSASIDILGQTFKRGFAPLLTRICAAASWPPLRASKSGVMPKLSAQKNPTITVCYNKNTNEK